MAAKKVAKKKKTAYEPVKPITTPKKTITPKRWPTPTNPDQR